MHPACSRSAALLALAAAVGCTRPAAVDAPEISRIREQSFKLIDRGIDHEVDGESLLALERFNRAALVHESPAAWYYLGREFEQADRIEQAATAYNRALELSDDFSEARLALLSIGYTPPNYTPSEADLQLAAQIAAERGAERERRRAASAANADRLAAQQTAENQTRRDTILAEAAARRLPTQAEVESIIFAPDVSQGAFPSALSPTYAPGADIVLGTYAYHVGKARQLRERNQIAAAEQEYQRAIELDPTQIDARLETGDMLLRQENFERALDHYRRALEDFPASPRPYHKLGNYFMDIGRATEAREYYRQALEKDPGFMESYNNLAVIDMRESKFDSARAILEEVIKQDPTFANAYLNRGIIASDVDRDREKALESFNRYVELGGVRAPEVRNWIRELQAIPN